MKLIALITTCFFGFTLTVKIITWSENNVQICSPTNEPNVIICVDLSYDVLRDLMFRNWLEKNVDSPADLKPDGVIDMEDFSELSKRWRNN